MVPFSKSASTRIGKVLPLAIIWLGFTATALRAVETATAHFKGRVTDTDGKLLPELKVMINRVSGAPIVGNIQSLNTLTDTSGAYDLPLNFQPSGDPIECELWFDKKQFVRVRKQIVIPLTNSIQSLDATLHPGLILSGTIRDEFSKRELLDNPALKEMPILFKVTGNNFKEYYVTEKDGTFEIYVPPGSYRITANLMDQKLDMPEVNAGTTNLLLAPQPFVWSEASVGKVFDAFWQEMDSKYSYFFLKPNIDWMALNNKYRPEAIQSTNVAELALVLQQMLIPLRDLHVNLHTPEGELATTTNRYRFNGNGRITREAIQEETRIGNYAIVGKTKEGFGYFLMLKQSNANDENVRQAITALQKLHDVPGFIVDLRAANGGSEPLAQEIARLFCATNTVYAKSKYRNGPGHQDFTQEYDRILKASKNAYTNPVVCLIGPGAVSSGEGFVKMMKCLPHVTTVGMPTRGASGNPKSFKLQGTGIEVSFSRWVDLLPNGQTLEGRGIPPDVLVDAPPSAYESQDPTLAKGLEILRRKLWLEKRPEP